MLTLRTTLLAGALTVAAGVAFAGAASAAGNDAHTMDVALPDGTVARVTYHGNVAPRVMLAPADVAALSPAGAAAPFAFDHLFAAMEREHEAMLRQAAAMQQQAQRQMALAEAGAEAAARAMPVAGTPAALGGATRADALPPGTRFSYTYVSTTSGPHGCTRTVEWRSDGSAKQPQVIRAASGDCDGAGKSAGPVPASAPAPTPAAPVKPA